MNCLVTGAAGFIGSHLCERLLQAGHSVVGIDAFIPYYPRAIKEANLGTALTHPGFSFRDMDLRHDALDKIAGDCETIFHLAAMVGIEKIINEPINTIEVNIGGTETLLKTARRYRKKIMIASTSEVYGKGASFPFHEDDDSLLGPTIKNRWSYAASKLVDEFLALAYYHETQLPVVLFRLFNTIGPRQSGQYGMVVPRFVQWAAFQPELK